MDITRIVIATIDSRGKFEKKITKAEYAPTKRKWRMDFILCAVSSFSPNMAAVPTLCAQCSVKRCRPPATPDRDICRRTFPSTIMLIRLVDKKKCRRSKIQTEILVSILSVSLNQEMFLQHLTLTQYPRSKNIAKGVTVGWVAASFSQADTHFGYRCTVSTTRKHPPLSSGSVYA